MHALTGTWRKISVCVAAGLLASCGAPDSGFDPADGPSAVPELAQAAPTAAPTFVSLNPCTDAILTEVAAPEQILALSHYSRDPSSSSISQDVAGQFDVTGGTAEEVIALDPDIVLASSFISPSTRAAFEQLGVQVETFGSPLSVDESMEQIRQVGRLTGHGSEAEALVRDIMHVVLGANDSREFSTLLWQAGQIVPGEATLVGEMLRKNGFTSHSAARGLGQGDFVALETLLADPPELVLVAGDNAGQAHPLLSKLDKTEVETFDPKLLYCGAGTLIAVQNRLDQIRVELL